MESKQTNRQWHNNVSLRVVVVVVVVGFGVVYCQFACKQSTASHTDQEPDTARGIVTKVCRYKWHSAGSLGWPFPMLKHKFIFQIKYTEAVLSNNYTRSETVMVCNYQNADCCFKK